MRLCISCAWKTYNLDIEFRYVLFYNEPIKAGTDGKRPELANRNGGVIHSENARPHISLVTRQKLVQFGCDILLHTPNSPGLKASEYHT